jgi:hypothetical protein
MVRYNLWFLSNICGNISFFFVFLSFYAMTQHLCLCYVSCLSGDLSLQCIQTCSFLIALCDAYSGNNVSLINFKSFSLPNICHLFDLGDLTCKCAYFQCGTGWVSMLGLIGTHTSTAQHGEYSEMSTYFGILYNSRQSTVYR